MWMPLAWPAGPSAGRSPSVYLTAWSSAAGLRESPPSPRCHRPPLMAGSLVSRRLCSPGTQEGGVLRLSPRGGWVTKRRVILIWGMRGSVLGSGVWSNSPVCWSQSGHSRQKVLPGITKPTLCPGQGRFTSHSSDSQTGLGYAPSPFKTLFL